MYGKDWKGFSREKREEQHRQQQQQRRAEDTIPILTWTKVDLLQVQTNAAILQVQMNTKRSFKHQNENIVKYICAVNLNWLLKLTWTNCFIKMINNKPPKVTKT